MSPRSRLSRWLLTFIGGMLAFGLSLPALAQSQAAPPGMIFMPLLTRTYSAYSEWTQEAHDAQRTGSTPIEPLTPWTLLWTWNASDANGGSSCPGSDPTKGHCYNAPREARTVAGGGGVYVPAGANGLYGLNAATGQVLWHLTGVTFNATPAYDPNTVSVFAGAANGLLYKVNAVTGAFQTYTAGGAINRAVLLTGGFVYALTDTGASSSQLHKVSAADLSQAWVYSASSASGTGLAYSLSRDALIFGTADLYVQAVNNPSGTQKWRVKPSPNTAGFPNQFLYYWPVVADKTGVVFVRMRLDHNAGLWGYNSSGGIWPNTNAEARSFLVANPAKQNLFALNLDNGTVKFVPAVGYGGTEDFISGQAYLTTGPLPAIRTIADKEVAYITFRNGQSQPPDGRWDSHMGEMVLDSSTVPGLAAGDLRFVRMSRYKSEGGNAMVHITDEQNPITVAGNTIFHAHWGASESVRITNRANSLGLSYGSPIATVNNPAVIRRQATCGNFNATTHYTTCGLTLFGDGRYWDGPGFWTYWNTWDPPTPASAGVAYSDGLRPRYTYVSGALIVVEGNGGDLMVFRHSGS